MSFGSHAAQRCRFGVSRFLTYFSVDALDAGIIAESSLT
jgi:hypothetical protein